MALAPPAKLSAASRARRAGRRLREPRAASAFSLVAVVLIAVGTVAGLDTVLSDRVRSGTDNTMRLSVILPYVGVDHPYVVARAFGLAAGAFAAVAVAAGIHQRTKRLVGNPTPAWIQAAHRHLGLLTVALIAGHLAIPFSSPAPPLGGWATMLMPLAQPPQWGTNTTLLLSAGILAFWMFVLLGPVYLLLGRRRRWWSAIHVFTIVAYAMSVIHAFWVGSDLMVQGAARIAILAAQVPLVVLAARWLFVEARQGAGAGDRARSVACHAGAATALAGAGALIVVTILGGGGLQLPAGG